jgi:two-component system CheB/CheR fusion protein
MNGLQVTAKLRSMLRRHIPVIILTGDISSGTLHDIALQNCVRLNKPVKTNELMEIIQRLLPQPQSADRATPPQADEVVEDADAPIVFVVDDDSHIRDGIRQLLEEGGRRVKGYATCEAFLAEYRPGSEACLLVDAYLPGMNGLELLQQLNETGHWLPAIMITGYGDVPTAVLAMKAGALDFIEKPVSPEELVASVETALNQSRDATKLEARRESAKKVIAGLTARQHEVMTLVLAGRPNKIIAEELGISQRTVENHRAVVMKKTGAISVPGLVRIAAAAC